MSSQLTPFWIRFRKRLTKKLMAQGLPKSRAILISSRETKDRAFVAKLVGDKAALAAEFVLDIRDDGTFSQYAAVKPSGIPSGLLPQAIAWANAGRNSVSKH
ncbi:hypothetical protein LJR251_000289 [Rhizobium rhizogenes]|uniref:hypothetical protein n=1 Tax=Rhizobium rhizogenes TaxID=359 RepID=UPI003ECD39B9